MNGTETVLLTTEGWRELVRQLGKLQYRRAMLGALASSDSALGIDGDPRIELSALDHRIGELEQVLKRSAPVDRSALPPDTVGVGSRVTVRWDEGSEETYTVVGPPEVSPQTGRISYESPVGRALIGCRPGELIMVPTIDGTSQLTVLTVGQGLDHG